MDLTLKIKNNIISQRLLNHGDIVILGVSGGPDSVALTHIFYQLQPVFGFKIHIAHFNHHIRKDSNKDEKLVKNLAQKFNFPFTSRSWSVKKRLLKGSIEDNAREARIEFFTKLARQIKAQAVVLAHTQDDQAETVLMRIIRGTGLQGLRGILPKNKINGLNFVRPLLEIQKKELLTFLKKNKIHYRVDSTNAQTMFFRNKVRLKLLPFLEKEFNPNIREGLTHLSENLTADYHFLSNEVDRIFPKLVKNSSKATLIPLKKLKKLPISLQRMLIRKVIKEMKGDTNLLTLAHLKEVEGLSSRPNGSIVHLPQGIEAQNDLKYLKFLKY